MVTPKKQNQKKGSSKTLLDEKEKLELDKKDLEKHQQMIENIDKRDAKSYIPRKDEDEDKGLSGEELLKMVKRTKNKK